MAGSLDLFDSVQYTAGSEYSSRQGEQVDTLQIHHATMTSLSGLIGMMQPGGRTVSANGALSNDGHLVEVVPLSARAFTSASGYDRRCLTVETCNTTLSPEWGISEASRLRLARLAVDMYRAGLLGGLNRQYIIGHYEVPGTYATSCPGPSMDLDRIVWLANQIYSGAITAGGDYDRVKEIKVKSLHYGDRRQTVLYPGQVATLKSDAGAPQDISGGLEGPFSFTQHAYVNAAPGDSVELRLVWFDQAAKRRSAHYTERVVADRSGLINVNVEFKRAVGAGTSVLAEVVASASNTGPVTVSVLDIDAFLFVVA